MHRSRTICGVGERVDMHDIEPNTSSAADRELPEPVSILMPACNEADIIVEVVDEWVNDVLRFCPAGSELVFDDCSNDGTEKILRDLAVKYPFIRINFAPRDGFFKSTMRLYRLATCPLIFFTDSDGQYVPAQFWEVARYIGDYDMVHGAKVDRKDPLYRVRASYVFNMLIRVMFRSRCQDVNSAFRLIRRPMLNAVLHKIHHLTMLPNAELYIRGEAAGFRIKNIAVMHRERKYGKSRSLPFKVFARECWKAFIGLIRLRTEVAKESVPRAAIAPGKIGK